MQTDSTEIRVFVKLQLDKQCSTSLFTCFPTIKQTQYTQSNVVGAYNTKNNDNSRVPTILSMYFHYAFF